MSGHVVALTGSALGRRRRRGFTLLEVMISLAILAISLVALADLNGGAVAMEAYARRATQATLLLRGKMLDIEDELHKDGFHDFDDEKHGTFEEEGATDYSWRAEILKPDIQLDADQLLSQMGLGGAGGDKSKSSSSSGAAMGAGALGALSGAMGAGGAAGGAGGALAAAAGPFAGMIQGQAKTFIETLKKSVREVRITVSWQDGKLERNVSASQEMVILPESVGKAGATGAPTAINQTGQAGQPGSTQPSPLGGPIKLPSNPSADGDSQ